VSARPVIQADRQAITILPPGEGYERWASCYDDAPNPVIALEERKVAPLLPELQGKRVLDLGCGTGRWLRILGAHLPASLVGVDRSPAMLGVARRSFAGLVRADCVQLPFAHGVFDFVICSFAVGHLPDLAVFARECARILKPKGTLFVTDLHPKAYAMGWRTGFRDGKGAVQIRTISHPWGDSVQLFSAAGLACDGIHEFGFAKPEQAIFLRAGKNGFFSEASEVPAVLLGRFWRMD
jgi:malonyl-CoA O-methyltransferase